MSRNKNFVAAGLGIGMGIVLLFAVGVLASQSPALGSSSSQQNLAGQFATRSSVLQPPQSTNNPADANLKSSPGAVNALGILGLLGAASVGVAVSATLFVIRRVNKDDASRD